MNCFNIRELQGNLKRKFFTDLVNSNDHRDFLNQSILGMRFKNNNDLAITPDMEAFYNFGTTSAPKAKSFNFTNSYESANTYFTSLFTNVSLTSSFEVFANASNILSNVVFHLKSVFELLTSLTPYSLTTITSLFSNVSTFTTYNLNHFNFTLLSQTTNVSVGTSTNTSSVTFNSENISTTNTAEGISSSFSEVTNSYRFNRFSNPLISYDYKCGHYLGI
jgi:hypothetical protein